MILYRLQAARDAARTGAADGIEAVDRPCVARALLLKIDSEIGGGVAMSETGMHMAVRLGAGLFVGLSVLAASIPDAGACGAYFARRLPATAANATANLFNSSTNMVVARADTTTTITMTADYRGDPKEFAVVIAVPTVLTREQIKIADAKLIDWLDRLGAPRLTEAHDPDPCPSVSAAPTKGASRSAHVPGAVQAAPQRPSLGVVVEAQYAVGEYDIAILSAAQSDGLRIWLNEAGYNVPPAAEPVLAAYIADGLKFFVAKVNLAKKQELGFAQLQPLQISYQSPKFMVPVRLSTVNAEGPQEMFVHLLTQKGRVEAANYPTRTIPTNLEVPPFVKNDYPAFYRAVFDQAVRASSSSMSPSCINFLRVRTRCVSRTAGSRSWVPPGPEVSC
jgi:hypothetical protein